jgi:hypothetical protein
MKKGRVYAFHGRESRRLHDIAHAARRLLQHVRGIDRQREPFSVAAALVVEQALQLTELTARRSENVSLRAESGPTDPLHSGGALPPNGTNVKGHCRDHLS